MAIVVAGTDALTAGFNQTVSTGVVTTQTIPASINLSTSYTNGTAAGKIDALYAKQLTLAATPTTLDLQALPDLTGTNQVLLRVREIIIQVVTATVDFNVTLGNAASNAFSAIWGATGTNVVMAGSIYHITDPTTVGSGKGYIVDATHKNLKLDPGSNSVVVNIIIAGCTAVS
jgi:hypothetical protein